jgi:hypothetical protein
MLSSAAPRARGNWRTRLLSWLGVTSSTTDVPSADEQPSAQLRARLDAMVEQLPSR